MRRSSTYSTGIQAIPTRYKGYHFRSRLEARWAVFFDALGIKWEYEPQGYALDGVPYLPDFRITAMTDFPDVEDFFVEVKHECVSLTEGQHVDLCRALAKYSGSRVLLLNGSAAATSYMCFAPDGSNYLVWFFDGGFVQENDYTESELRCGFDFTPTNAINAARSAQFEHGESGAT